MDKNLLCKKIQEIYSDIGECGIDISVDFDDEQRRWTVNLKKDDHELKTYLEHGDAEKCINGVQCVSLGIEVAQLKDSIQRMPTR